MITPKKAPAAKPPVTQKKRTNVDKDKGAAGVDVKTPMEQRSGGIKLLGGPIQFMKTALCDLEKTRCIPLTT